jgi:GNAT superfamily N-acetyltransferase
VEFTSNDAIHLADDIEAGAYADMYAAAPPALGLRCERVGPATVLLAPRIPVSYFNRVIGLGGRVPATQRELDAALDLFRGAGVADFWLHLTPSARPTELKDWIEARGLRPPARRAWVKFLRTPAPAAELPRHLPAVRAAAAADAPAVAHTAVTAFGMPPSLGEWFASLIGRRGWSVLVAEADGRIVATGSVFIRDGTGWLGIGATLPDYRRRGAQTALLAARVAAAAQAGCTVVATETGESVADEPNPSLANIRRAGFVQVCSRANFASKV